MTSKDFRYQWTIDMVKRYVPNGSRILDLGTDNELAERLRIKGYIVENTKGENLDDIVTLSDYGNFDAVTAFEIFEHLLAPYNVLKTIPSELLISTVPLKLWFKDAYWNDKEQWDCHYHEFEVKQFKMLLRRTNWEVVHSELHKDKVKPLGFRPLLRNFHNRYYGVVARKLGSGLI